ncbi:MAG TPA: hypothetical protein VH375_07245 [Rhodanobacteraceae bacterium]
MFRDESVIESAAAFWQAPKPQAAAVRHRAAEAALDGNDEVGAVWHVYREIARRIPRNAYTRHASKLGEISR